MAKLSPQDPLHVLHLALEPAGGSGPVVDSDVCHDPRRLFPYLAVAAHDELHDLGLVALDRGLHGSQLEGKP